jgi:hypothetical protein
LLIPKKPTCLFFSTQILKPTVFPFKQNIEEAKISQKEKNTLYSKKNRSQLKATKLQNQFLFSKPRNTEKKFLFNTRGLKKDHHKKITYFFEKIPSSSFCVSGERYTMQLNCLKPLENIGRSTVSKFLCLYKFPVITDVTNFSSNFSRNKIRHNVGPFIQSFLKKKTDYRVTQFFKTLNHEHYEIQNELFSLYCLALLAKYEFTEKTKTPNKWCLQPFLSDMLPKFVGIGLKKSLLHKFFADYKDIELSFLQICTLQFFTCGSD